MQWAILVISKNMGKEWIKISQRQLNITKKQHIMEIHIQWTFLVIFIFGKGVEQDQKKAIKYYKKRQILEIEMQLTVSMQ